jgi:general secretion pathway protein J
MWSKNNRGMTLIEVMVAMFILAGMTFLLQMEIGNRLDAIDLVEKRDAMVHGGRVAMRRLVMDLGNAFVVAPTLAMLGSQQGNPVIDTRFHGQGRGGRDELSFTTFSHMRYVKGARESDQATVSYKVETDPDDSENLQLLRREVPTIDAGSAEKGTAYAIADHIKSFTLQYLDIKTNEWRSDWDSKDPARQTRLPRAVKIQLEIADPKDKDNVLKLSTIALIQLWQTPIEF